MLTVTHALDIATSRLESLGDLGADARVAVTAAELISRLRAARHAGRWEGAGGSAAMAGGDFDIGEYGSGEYYGGDTGPTSDVTDETDSIAAVLTDASRQLAPEWLAPYTPDDTPEAPRRETPAASGERGATRMDDGSGNEYGGAGGGELEAALDPSDGGDVLADGVSGVRVAARAIVSIAARELRARADELAERRALSARRSDDGYS